MAAAIVVTASVQADLGILPSWFPASWACAVAFVSALPLAAAKVRQGIPTAVPGLDAALRAITVHRVVRTLAACFTTQAGVLVLSAGPDIQRALDLDPAPWGWVWDAAPFTGALLAAAGIVIAVIPVRSFARTAAPGSRLPTVRSLVADLGIATGTVARAYKELEAAGLVHSRRRGGTVVAAPAAGIPGARGTVPVPPAVQAAVDHYIEAGRAAGLRDEVLVDVLRGKLGRDAR